MEAHELLELADWRRQMFDLYRRVREADDPVSGWELWKSSRDQLFRTHHQSPLPVTSRKGFEGIEYFPYDPAFRVIGQVSDLPPKRYDIATSDGGTFSFTRFARVDFELAGSARRLELYWLDGYGGGLFLPFKDATSGRQTYGGGRYLLDTVKGADLGNEGSSLMLDFNLAYNPSCSYDPRWVCPLSPPENNLDLAVAVGERYP